MAKLETRRAATRMRKQITSRMHDPWPESPKDKEVRSSIEIRGSSSEGSDGPRGRMYPDIVERGETRIKSTDAVNRPKVLMVG